MLLLIILRNAMWPAFGMINLMFLFGSQTTESRAAQYMLLPTYGSKIARSLLFNQILLLTLNGPVASLRTNLMSVRYSKITRFWKFFFQTFETFSCILQEKDAYETEFRDLLVQPVRDGWQEMLKELIKFEQLEREMENQLDAQALDVEGNVEGMTFRGEQQCYPFL
jgi:hypothetical protein